MATILIVDDRPSNRQFLTTLLGYGGHRMLEAEDGEQALDAVRTEHPALVITDILMPKMDGYEFVHRVRSDPQISATPVIFYTATYSSPQAEALARSCGVRTVLSKPCEPQLMLDAVNRELGVSDQVAAAAQAGNGSQPKAEERQPDDTVGLFLKDLDAVKQRFEDLAARSAKLQIRRETVNELSKKFAANIASMQRMTTRLSALLEVGMELTSERNPQRLVELFFAACCDLVDSKVAAVGMLDATEQSIAIVFAKGVDAGLLRGDGGRAGVLGKVLSGHRAMRMRAASHASGTEGMPEKHPKVRTLLCVPVASADRVYGWMYFADKRGKNGFTEEDTRLVSAMTRKLALLYENAMLYDTIQRHAAQLQVEVSERRRAQEVLHERDAGLRRAQQMAKLAHVISLPDGSFESWSETLPQMLGLSDDTMPRDTRTWLDFLHPEDREIFRSKAVAAATTGARFECDYRLKGTGNSWLQIRQVSEPLDATDNTTGERRWFGTLQDVSDSKQAEDRIRRLNRVYAVLSGVNALIARVRDREELYKESCRVAVEDGGFGMAWIGTFDQVSLDVTPVAWYGMDESAVSMKATARGDVPAGQGMVGRAIRGKTAVITNDILADPGAGGPRRAEALRKGFHSIVAMPLIVRGEVKATLTLFARERNFFSEEEVKLLNELAGDISFALDHLEKSSKLDYLAYFDALTGLANRANFHQQLMHAVEAARQGGHKMAVVVLDIDRFKSINASLGREAGDELLRKVAERMKQISMDPGAIARIGADRFAVVRPNVASVEDVARHNEQRMEVCFGIPYHVGGTELRIAVKAGIALFPADGEDADSLFTNAEAALKKAKAAGERALFYAQEMNERVAENLLLETRLRRALENEEFVLYYQPKVDLETRAIVGAEALIRWQSPELGLVPPAKFIPLLEETGMIMNVGSWALKRAALDHRGLVEQHLQAPRIAVNVSSIQLRKQDFVATVEQAIKDGVQPPGIDLEITESLLMQDVDASIQKLKQLRDLGMSVAIDDFGTGYSSLAYLAKLPLESLKIDRAFIVNMLDDADSATLVQTMITLAHTLKLKVVAEGVETEDQAKILRLLKCDQMQGYLFSKPVPLDVMTTLLQKAKT